MYNSSAKYLAEFISTFALVIVGAGAICINQFTGGQIGLIGIALAHGITIMAMVYAFGHVSGAHINPAVTLAMLFNKKINLTDAMAYWVSQFMGAVIAAFVLQSYFPGYINAAPYLGVPALTAYLPGFGLTQALFAEFVGTFFLVSVIFGVAVDERGLKPAAGLAIGLTVTAGICFAGPLTGAAFNPARAFGPALVTGQLSNLWVYFAAPCLGALSAAACYTKFFASKKTLTQSNVTKTRFAA